MKYQYDWEKTKQRYRALWEKEIVDRVCISIPVIPSIDGRYPAIDKMPKDMSEADLCKNYTDADIITKRCIEKFENTYFAGDALACVFPNFGTAGHVQYLGAEPVYLPETIWYKPSMEEYDLDRLKFSKDNKAFKRHFDLVKTLVEKSNGQYFVSMPDNVGVLDALSELRGSDNLLFDLFDEPELVKEACKRLVEVQKESNTAFFEAIKSNNDNGSTHGWMHTWNDGFHGQIQCDFSVMISEAHFEEFALPNLIASSEWMDRAIYHLDGSEQLRHLDMILSVDSIDMIQWVPVAGQPPVTNYIDSLQKIQRSGKGLVLILEPDELEPIMSSLSSKGLQLIINTVKSKEQADEMIRYAEKHTKE